MYEPQDDDATRQADAVDATDMAPTVLSAPGSDAVVDAFAWSQEEDGAGAEPVPYVHDPYDQDPGTTRRVAVSPATAVPGRRAPARWPRIAVIVGSGVALIAVAGALYSLARTEHEEAPDAPVTSTGVVPPVLSSALPPSTPAPPPVVTTSAPPPVTTTVPPTTTTTTAPPSTTTTTTAPPTTTSTTTAPPTTTTAPPSSSEPPTTTAPPTTTTVPMTTEYLTIPFVPVPIPITVPQN